MSIVYDNSKAVKINDEMRSGLNTYNQRKSEIDTLIEEIAKNQTELDAKNKEIEALETAINSEDKKAAKDANKKLKGLQKETERLLEIIKELEDKKVNLRVKQNHADINGVQTKLFPPKDETGNTQTEPVGEYKEEESFIPTEEPSEKTEDDTKEKISEEDLDVIWNKLHNAEENTSQDNNEEITSQDNNEEITPVYDTPEEIVPVYETETETPVSIFSDTAELVEADNEEKEDISKELDNPSIIEPTVISEEVTEEPKLMEEAPEVSEENEEMEFEPLETEDIILTDNESINDKVHNQIDSEFPNIEIPEPMDSEKKLKTIYEEVDVEPKLLDKSPTRDLKNLTLFIDYNDYTFTFAQQHYNKEALTPEELGKLDSIKSYLNELEFNAKRTIQYNKITAENKRLNRKIVTLSKEFTKTIDKLSKDYVATTEELTNQTNKAKEQVEIDRVEKVQTQKLNESLTENIKEQNAQIDSLNDENTGLKETIEARDETIKELKAEIKDKAEKIKVFEEKLNTVLGIVKEVKNEKKEK